MSAENTEVRLGEFHPAGRPAHRLPESLADVRRIL